MKSILASFTALLAAVTVTVSAADSRPKFSWDRVPLYAHVGLGRGLTPEQYKFLADYYDFIAFTGGSVDREYRSNDQITFERIVSDATKTVKLHNPEAKVLFYWASDMPKPQWKLSNATFPKGCFVTARKGGKDSPQFDVRLPEVREWWSGIAGKAVHDYGCDGIFVDGATAGRVDGPWSKMFGAKQAAEMDQGMFAMLNGAREKMGPDKLIVFNPLHGYDKDHPGLGEQYLPATDGAMVDDFDRNATRQQSPEYMANTIEAMRKATAHGKIVVFKGWPKFTWHTAPEIMKKPREEQLRLAREQITFPLACFLIGAGEYSYFCYTWGWLPEHGALDKYAEFEKPLGPPAGSAVRAGWVFRREFSHASVFVDLEKKTAKIDWK